MMDARWYRGWPPGGLVMSGGLDNGCQVVIRWPEYVIFSGQFRGLSGGPDEYPGIDAGLENSK